MTLLNPCVIEGMLDTKRMRPGTALIPVSGYGGIGERWQYSERETGGHEYSANNLDRYILYFYHYCPHFLYHLAPGTARQL